MKKHHSPSARALATNQNYPGSANTVARRRKIIPERRKKLSAVRRNGFGGLRSTLARSHDPGHRRRARADCDLDTDDAAGPRSHRGGGPGSPRRADRQRRRQQRSARVARVEHAAAAAIGCRAGLGRRARAAGASQSVRRRRSRTDVRLAVSAAVPAHRRPDADADRAASSSMGRSVVCCRGLRVIYVGGHHLQPARSSRWCRSGR